MSNFVLDASALLALLNDETGSQRVREALPNSTISSVNLCEAAGKLVQTGMAPDDVTKTIDLLGLEVLPFDKQTAYRAGSLIAQTKKWGLSLGDRAAIALAMELKHRILTADQIWFKLKLDVEIECIRGGPSSEFKRQKRDS